MGIVLGTVLVITAVVNFNRRDIAYTAVILWALASITFKQAGVSTVTIPTWVTFGLVAITLLLAFIIPRKVAAAKPIHSTES